MMNTVQHTPAPWTTDPTTDYNATVRVMDEQGVTVALCYQQPFDTWTAAANARLIAATPELYDVVVSLRNCLNDWVEIADDDDMRDDDLSAIKNANDLIARLEEGGA